MSEGTSRWHRYWSALDSPQHRYDDQEWFRFSADELLMYCPRAGVGALELGCGSGELYPFLQQRFTRYVGSDFSAAMLGRFRSRAPEVSLICANATELPLRRVEFDFIFSNGVCQYLTPSDLARNLEQVHTLLAPGAVYLIANIPDRELRLKYYSGALRADRTINRAGALKAVARSILGREDSGIGNWYVRREIAELAGKSGFRATTYSSATYEYRFHAVLRPV